MENHKTVVLFVSFVAALCGMVAAQSSNPSREQKLAIRTFGGYPVSDNISSLWLAGSDGRPLLIVYFHGPRGWHKTQWKIDFKLENASPGWVQLGSENVTERIDVYPETWEVAIQGSKFSLRQSNTFLVLHTGELLVPQKVIPLGVFKLPQSTEKPPSLVLLRSYLELAERIDQEGRAGIHASEVGKSRHPSVTPPCQSFGSRLLFPPVITHGKLLPSKYSIPCWKNISMYIE